MASLLLSVAVNAGLYFLSRALAPTQKIEGPKLKEAQITSSTEGVPLPKLFGRMRLGGNMIWATNFTETKRTEKQGGKGGGGGVENTTYTYDCSFAVAFCEGGDNVQLGRVWADGKLIDLSLHTVRFYTGSNTQLPDSFMETVEGAGQVPAYRGTAYLMFERFQLEKYGNRIPQITAEIIKPLDDVGPDDLEYLLEGVCLIPASGEFAYATESFMRDDGRGGVATENVHNSEGIPNAVRSLDLLEQSAPNMGTVLLVVSWFGSDLRVGECRVRPKVEFLVRASYESEATYVHYIDGQDGGLITIKNDGGSSANVDVRLSDTGATVASYTIASGGEQAHKFDQNAAYTIIGVVSAGGATDNTVRTILEVFENDGIFPQDWRVSGLNREDAQEVPRDPANPGSPVYGGTPSDISIKQSIQDIKARGWRVAFYPFILMDQLTGNGLPDPYGGAEQQPLPWRGRITCHPAAGQPGTVDKTGAAATQVSAFFGAATVANVPAGGDGLPAWTGSPTEFGYRRMVLHYARLCQMAGGVDAFLIGTELRGITRIRSSATAFPAVTAFQTLAADVRSILGSGTLISYAADWSEYSNYAPGDGSGDVFFHLDPLWADSNIDFIGVDNYVPLSDWRDGTAHLDYDEANGITNPYVMSYLKDNIEGGEGFDWFYASDSDRNNQVRTPITDGAYGKPWVFRYKDFRNWWENAHYNRPGGVESGSPTAWTPKSKPIWFTEFGCPAIDKGPNQPNVFFDPKSSESAVPYFSSGRRDDLIQRRYLEAMFQYWRDNGGDMVDTANMLVWTWDARPYPEFPFRSDVWSDGENWRLGHWLNGRLGVIPLALLVQYICRLGGLTNSDVDVSGLYGSSAIVRGYVIDNIMSPRDMLEPLMGAYNFDGYESEGLVKFNMKANAITVTIDIDQLVSTDKEAGGYSLTRAQETELPAVIKVAFYDEEHEYDQAAVDGRKLTGNSLNVQSADFPMVLTLEYARQLADIMIHEAWQGRDRGELSLPNSLLRIDPGDVVRIEVKGREFNLRVTGQEAGEYRKLEAQGFDQSVFDDLDYSGGNGTTPGVTVLGRSLVEFMDLPLLTGAEPNPWAPRVVAYQKPWPGAVNVFEDDLAGGFSLNIQVPTDGAMGELVAPLFSGPVGLWDNGNTVLMDLYGNDQMLSTTDLAVFAGANAIAVQNGQGGWEVLQFQEATLVAPRRYRLSRLLRGQLGTEVEMRDPVPAGARVVFLDATDLPPLDLTIGQLNSPLTLRYGAASLPVSDTRYQDETRTFTGIGLRPYAPVHLDGARVSGDIVLEWIRRTRLNGDSWDLETVPLNEESERYEIDIMDGSTVVRTLTSTTPSVTYTSAQEAADFGSSQMFITFRVYQMSAAVGRGRMAEETISV